MIKIVKGDILACNCNVIIQQVAMDNSLSKLNSKIAMKYPGSTEKFKNIKKQSGCVFFSEEDSLIIANCLTKNEDGKIIFKDVANAFEYVKTICLVGKHRTVAMEYNYCDDNRRANRKILRIAKRIFKKDKFVTLEVLK